VIEDQRGGRSPAAFRFSLGTCLPHNGAILPLRCDENVVSDSVGRVSFDRPIRRCIELSREAVAAGSHPFGALLGREDRLVMEACNRVAVDGVTGHAELDLVRRSLAGLGREVLAGCALYTTEP